MPVNLSAPDNLLTVSGIRLGTTSAAIKTRDRDDIALIELAKGSQTAAVFTRNAFAAAPVQLARERLAGSIRALLINSGNANAGTGQAGLEAATACCDTAAQALGLEAESILPFSTGVIGQALPVARMQAAIPVAAQSLDTGHWQKAATAMMTTDTVAKGISRQIELPDGRKITLTGIAKGSGMIRPDMATMLGYVGTDAPVSRTALQRFLESAAEVSFNSISVDGDTSTNDACVLMATGQAGGPEIEPNSAAGESFAEALKAVCIHLAQSIVRDAEGATRFVTVDVTGAGSVEEARQVAFTVAHSPLVKTAWFAGDPNWGRILAAVGRAGLVDLDMKGVDIALDEVSIIRAGEPSPNYYEPDAAAVMAQPEFIVHIGLGRGDAAARIWTCDLSYEYVRINAEYRS